MKEVTIYTDGACSGNPGPGGWVEFIKVVGHNDDKLNNRCDKLAKMAIPKEAA